MRIAYVLLLGALAVGMAAGQVREISRAELLDRIAGGWAGQMIGNIQGLPYEFKYKEKPGPIPEFVPNLPECRSDDDTDIELLHLLAMDRLRTLKLPYPVVAREWVGGINQAVWIANARARDLMRAGVPPPWTGHPALNPHAHYNLSGQFCAESYGLLAPGLPRAAGEIGLHYTRISIRGEPEESTAWTTALVSLAFFEHDVGRLLDQARKSVRPESQHAEMLADVAAWHAASPGDWRAVRDRIHEKYFVERGWNWNATITNGALVVAALLFGEGDFTRTLQLSFAMGYDADCNAALCGTVLGVMEGASRMAAQPGWILPEVYVNVTRDRFPKHLTLEYISAMTLRLAELAIRERGGRQVRRDGEVYYRIPVEEPMALTAAGPREAQEKEAVEAAILAGAARALRGRDATARALAALRLAQVGGPALELRRARVRQVLEETRDRDPVLTLYARQALAGMKSRE